MEKLTLRCPSPPSAAWRHHVEAPAPDRADAGAPVSLKTRADPWHRSEPPVSAPVAIRAIDRPVAVRPVGMGAVRPGRHRQGNPPAILFLGIRQHHEIRRGQAQLGQKRVPVIVTRSGGLAGLVLVDRRAHRLGRGLHLDRRRGQLFGLRRDLHARRGQF